MVRDPVPDLALVRVRPRSLGTAPPRRRSRRRAPMVLKAARLFDGRGRRRGPQRAWSWSKDGKIKAVGTGLAVPAGAQVIDLGDATLLPGFIDAHTHLTGESTDNWLQGAMAGMRRVVAESAMRATEYARRTVHGGLHDRPRRGSGRLTSTWACATPSARVSSPARACWWRCTRWARAAATATTPASPTCCSAAEPGMADGIAAGADGFRDAVRFQVKYGADVIKVCATGGVLSLADEVDTPQLTQEEMDALVDEAHRLRKKTAAHAHGAEGAKVAIRAGIDSIEHGSFLDDEALRLMKERGTYLVPTAHGGEVRGGHAGGAPLSAGDRGQGAGRGAAHGAACSAARSRPGVKVAFGTDSGGQPPRPERGGVRAPRGPRDDAGGRAAGGHVRRPRPCSASTSRWARWRRARRPTSSPSPATRSRTSAPRRRCVFVMRGGTVHRNDAATAAPKP